MIKFEIDEVIEFLQMMWLNKVDLFSCDVRNNYALNYYDALAINEIPLLIRDLKEFKQYYENHNDELMFVELDCLKKIFHNICHHNPFASCDYDINGEIFTNIDKSIVVKIVIDRKFLIFKG